MPRRRTSAANWRKPLAWNAGHEKFFAQHGRRQRVFCASLADVFDNAVDPQWRMDLLQLIADTPNLDWLLLTKRIGNAHSMLDKALAELSHGLTRWEDAPWPNVWIGATIVNQAEADRDIPKLLAVPARVRFLSMEPLLGPVDISHYMWPVHWTWDARYRTPQDALAAGARAYKKRQALVGAHCQFLDWVIVGGESGPAARPMHPEWVRGLRDQCKDAGVPFLFKQWGEYMPISQQDEAFTSRLYRSNRKAALHEDQSALDDIYGKTCTVPYSLVHHDGSVHEVPGPMAFLQGTGAMTTFKVGKKAAGRQLDGQQHDGFPG